MKELFYRPDPKISEYLIGWWDSGIFPAEFRGFLVPLPQINSF